MRKDLVQAAEWYRRAAEGGDPNAQFQFGTPLTSTSILARDDDFFLVGLMLTNGEGVPQNLGEAVAWYLKAAEQGHQNAEYNIGIAKFLFPLLLPFIPF